MYPDLAGDDDSIANTAEKARQFLLCCQKIQHKDNHKIASTHLSRFNLWASNIGVFAERHASLDYRLRTLPTVKAAIEGNLEILCRHLLTGKK